MFICNYCRENALEKKGIGSATSRGACELCNYTDICTDIHGYKCKNDWKDFVYKENNED